ncbi:PAS domain S-box protein [Puteibacter caeruleilacunae]|nr:PAS domain S-box protein [Puteibacter caeruleilacunae]
MGIDYHHLIDNFPYSTLLVSLDRMVVTCNKAFEQLFGYKKDEIIEQKTSFLYPKYVNFIDIQNELDLVSEGAQEKVVELRTKEKKHIWCEAKIIHVRDDQQKVIGFLVTLREISREVTSKRNYFNWFAKHPAVMVVFDPDTMQIVRANSAAEKFYGYSFNEIKGMKLEKVVIAPLPRFQKKIKEALLHESVKYESKHRKADGSEVDVEVMINRIHQDGKWLLHIVIYDITRKKCAEDRVKLLSAAVDQSSVSVVITDTDGVIEYVNAACARISQYKTGELLGRKISVLRSGYHDKRFYEDLWTTLERGKSWSGEFRNRKKSGEYYWEEAVISPIKNNDGVITHYLAVKEDVTKYVKLVAELRRAKDKAEESDRLKSAFLASMSHEIRTPLNGIIGFSDLLKESSADSVVTDEFVELIHQSSERLLRTIDDIIETAKIETAEIQIERTKVDLVCMIDLMIRMFTVKLEKSDLVIVSQLKLLKENRWIWTDEAKIESVISNLINNAIKFTPSGEIAVSCIPREGFVEFCIADTGIGIPKDKIDNIFNRFEQIDFGNTRQYEGVGVGLTIAKAFVERLGGQIWVESELGKGSKFYFTIPNVAEN